MRLTRITTLMPLALGLVLPGAYAQGWIKYVNEQDQFVVNFPGEPEIVEVDYLTEAGATIPSRVYSVEDDSSRYAITVVDYTAAEAAHMARCRELQAALDIVSPNECTSREHLSDIRGALAFEAWNIRRRNSDGEITYDAFGQVDGVPGLQIQVLHPDESRTFAALYRLDGRLYVLEGRVPDDAPPPGLFQQSLGMLDEMGRRVRFESDAEGNYTRVQTLYEYIGEEDPITGEPASALSADDDGRIRAPGERTGLWMPELRADVVFLASLVEDPELLDRIDAPDVTAAELTRFRDRLVRSLGVGEFAWFQYQAGVLDEETLQAYLDPAAELFASDRAVTEWRNGLYSGDPQFMAYVEDWLNEVASSP